MLHELDASNESLGRLASKIAHLLRGKDKASFRSNVISNNEVLVKNLNKAKFTGSKINNKIYYRYSGYHGGIKARKLSELWDKEPDKVLRKMVWNMLPVNRSRDKVIKNLKFK